MLLVPDRRAPEGHDRVTNVLVDGAAMSLDHPRHRRQKSVEKLTHFGRAKLFGDPGKIPDIGEHHGHFPALASHRKITRVITHFGDQLRRHILAKQTRQFSLASCFHEIAINHVQEVQQECETQQGRERQHEVAPAPDHQVQHGNQQKYQYRHQRRRHDGNPGQHGGHQNREQYQDRNLYALDIARMMHDRLVQDSGNNVCVYLDTRKSIAKRRIAQIMETGSARPHEYYRPFQRILGCPAMQYVCRGDVGKTAQLPPVRDQDRCVFTNRNFFVAERQPVEVQSIARPVRAMLKHKTQFWPAQRLVGHGESKRWIEIAMVFLQQGNPAIFPISVHQRILEKTAGHVVLQQRDVAGIRDRLGEGDIGVVLIRRDQRLRQHARGNILSRIPCVAEYVTQNRRSAGKRFGKKAIRIQCRP